MSSFLKGCFIIVLSSLFTSCVDLKHEVSPAETSIVNDSTLVLHDIPKEHFPTIQSTEFSHIFIQNILASLFPDESEKASFIPANEDALLARIKSEEIDIALIEKKNSPNYFEDDELEYVLIGTDATIFLTSINNPVHQLSIEQINDIYLTKGINNWSKLSGESGAILLPEYSDLNSKIRLQHLLSDYQDPLFNITQEDLYSRIGFDYQISIPGYSKNDDFTLYCSSAFETAYRFSHPEQFKNLYNVKPVFIDGLKPSTDNILSGEFPFLTHVYAVVKKSKQNNDCVKTVINWLLSSNEATHLKIINGIGVLNTMQDLDLDVLEK